MFPQLFIIKKTKGNPWKRPRKDIKLRRKKKRGDSNFLSFD